ncbi:RNA polymerase sigma factor [Alistipes sp.]|uniref:RNA polymerase sigma factor n=1 Tax=Alistipes sp. TaxID=1872444 RepID=UPI003AEFB2AA
MEEQILAEGCSKGDDTARRELYDRYAGRLLAVALRYAGDRATAEDLMHDAFLKIYGAVGRFSYRGPGSLRAWMERITVNVALEWLRNRNRLGCVPLDEERKLPEAVEPASEEVARIPQAELLGMVGELPDGYRAVFNLYCIEGYSHREIAEMLGINEKSSSSQLFRARAMLARKIKAYLDAHRL